MCDYRDRPSNIINLLYYEINVTVFFIVIKNVPERNKAFEEITSQEEYFLKAYQKLNVISVYVLNKVFVNVSIKIIFLIFKNPL